MAARDERGDATTEAVLVTPVLLFLIGIIINFALWYHGSQIARAATQEGADAARIAGGTEQDGRSTTEKFVAQLGSSLVLDPQITVQRSIDNAAVELSAHSVAVVPGFSLPIHAKASAPTEMFRAAP